MPFRWPCSAKQQQQRRRRQRQQHPPATWGTKEVKERKEEVNKRRKGKMLRWNQMRGREIKMSGRLRVGGTFAPVHQRFHFLFFHTDVVDCGPLLCRRLLVLLHVVVVIVIVLKGVWTRWRCFIGHSEADNMGGRRGTVRYVLFTCTHTLHTHTQIHTDTHTHLQEVRGGEKMFHNSHIPMTLRSSSCALDACC